MIFDELRAIQFSLACLDIIEGKNDEAFINKIIERYNQIFYGGKILLTSNGHLKSHIIQLEEKIKKLNEIIDNQNGKINFLQGQNI